MSCQEADATDAWRRIYAFSVRISAVTARRRIRTGLREMQLHVAQFA